MSAARLLDSVEPDTTIPVLETYEQRCPFDYISPTNAELAPFIGQKWCVGIATRRLRERYPNSNIVSPAKYREAERKAIEARGWARPAEKTILDLINLVKYHWPVQEKTYETAPEITAARAILAKARVP